MNFEEINQKEDAEVEKTTTNIENKWNKISGLILNNKGDFLRKFLRVLNKERYEHYESLTKTMVKMKPNRSDCRNSTFYRVQSYRDSSIASQRRISILSPIPSSKGRLGIQFSSSKGNLRMPSYCKRRDNIDEVDEVDEQDISRVVTMMKAMNSKSRNNSTNTDSSQEDNKEDSIQNPNDFSDYLSELKKNSSKSIFMNSNEKKHCKKYFHKRIPAFKPLQTDSIRTSTTTKHIPFLSKLLESDKSKSQKDVFKVKILKPKSPKGEPEPTDSEESTGNSRNKKELMSPCRLIYRSMRHSELYSSQQKLSNERLALPLRNQPKAKYCAISEINTKGLRNTAYLPGKNPTKYSPKTSLPVVYKSRRLNSSLKSKLKSDF